MNDCDVYMYVYFLRMESRCDYWVGETGDGTQIGQCTYSCKVYYTQVINILHCCAWSDSDEKRQGDELHRKKEKGGNILIIFMKSVILRIYYLF